MIDWRAVAERVFKQESARILAGLIRLCRSFDWAEEALQDAFARALREWPMKGVPDNPGARIMAVARRRIVDRARRETTRAEYQAALAAHIEQRGISHDHRDEEPTAAYPDDRLRLMFTCCHPALNVEAQIALTLRTLAGLHTPEIARAFLVSESTMAQLAVGRELAGYQAFYTTRAELLRRLGRDSEALPYERSLGMTSNEVERKLLVSRIASLRSRARHG